MRKILINLLCLLSLTACQDFLDVNPNSSLETNIDSEEKIAELLTGAYPEASYINFLESRTDNVSERLKGDQNRLNEAMYFWQDYDQEDIDTPLNYWNACYAGIAKVNKALEVLPNFPKTPRVKALYGEAFLLRAYLHFMLVNIWCEPYGTVKSETDLGIPYMTKPEKNALVKYDRGTVAEVYRQIERDLKFGITLVDDTYYKFPKYHFNKAAAYAFASRFYLMKGEWDTVLQYANYVLGKDPKKVLRKWGNGFDKDLSLAYDYTKAEQPCNLLLTTTESRLVRELDNQKYGPTLDGVTEIFDNKGIDGCSSYKKLNLRSFFPFVQSQKATNGYFIPKFIEVDQHGATGERPRGLYVTNVLFTTDEVMLNRMEALTMLQRYDDAVIELQDFMWAKYELEIPCPKESYLWTSTDNYDLYTPFYGLTVQQLALVKTLTDFRQKEFFHEGLRWFDIRRFYLPVKRKTKNSNYRPLEKEDFRKVLQIPIEAINRGLEPNPRLIEDQHYHP